MKVVCINDDWSECHDLCEDIKKPIKHEMYTIVGVKFYLGDYYYKLEGFSDLYLYGLFKPLDDYLEQFTESLTKELIEVKQLELT